MLGNCVMLGGTLEIIGKFLITVIVSAIVLWIAQKVVLPTSKEKSFLSVTALALIWAIIDGILDGIFSFIHLGILGSLISLLIWIWVLKVWFDIGWIKAILISFTAWIISLVLGLLWGLAKLII